MFTAHRRTSSNRLYAGLLLAVLTLFLSSVAYFILMSSSTPSSVVPRVLLISTTFYPSLTDLRTSLALRTAAQARALSIPFLIVDGSADDVKAALRKEGALVLPEDPSLMGGKGKGFAYRYGIRQAMTRASSLLATEGEDYVICISEPEKVDFVRFLPSLTALILPHTRTPHSPNIVLPHRSPSSFSTLPIEQSHSEQFANLHLHNVQAALTQPTSLSSAPIDYLFGPVLFHSSLAGWWLSNDSPLWDAQIVPYIEAVKAGDGRVLSVDIDYEHPTEQTREEEGKAPWSAKRFMQLNAVIPALEKAMKAVAKPPLTPTQK